MRARDADIEANGVTRWLGVLFDRKLSSNDHLRQARVRVRAVIDHLERLSGTVRGPNAALSWRAIEACALSTLMYGAETCYS